MMTERFALDGEVEVFPGEGGWHYVRVPHELTDGIAERGSYGMVPVTVWLGSSDWRTPLMPMGDGSYDDVRLTVDLIDPD